MNRFWILLPLLFSGIICFSQKALTVYGGSTFAKGRYGGDWKNSYNVKANTGWFLSSGVAILLSKKLTLHSNFELANKKFTYSSGTPSVIQFKRTEECMYVGLKSALHINVLNKNNFIVTAGAGLFGNTALNGYYQQNRPDSFGPAFEPKGTLKIGNNITDSYRKYDAGVTIQIEVRYKNFRLLIMDDVSFINNLPKRYYTDANGMPLAAAPIKRKWQSVYEGVGYSFPLKSKNKL